ncbi:ATP-dependent Clp protease ATP-binding subunit [Candidatus Uhrbacteria bacterium]|nr:MAG: ATP-dependent Clp protease ATP-binding subunit [Candidatus Uhrbacteria bacterium]
MSMTPDVESVAQPSAEGILVWMPELDRVTFEIRKLRTAVHAGFHLLLALLTIGAFALAVWNFVNQDPATEVFTIGYVLSGAPAVSWFAVGVLIGCFLVFRLSAYGEQVASMPGWGLTRSKLKKLEEKKQALVEYDVSRHFNDAAWETIRFAYELATKTGMAELRPIHLFSAALSGPAGGIFMTRLGVEFDKIKGGIVALVREGEAGEPVRLSDDAKRVLIEAYTSAREARRKHVGPIEIFLASYNADERLQDVLDAAGYPPAHVRHVADWVRLQEQLREEQSRFRALARLKPDTAMNRSMTARTTPLLDRFSEDLTRLARNGYVPPLVGREKEMAELLRAVESGRRSVALVGDPGVGKAALVEGLARRMVEEDVPPELFDRRLVSVNVAQLIGAGDPALAPQRLISLLNEIALSGNIIIVMHGLEALVGTGAGGTMDLAEMLAAEVDKGYFLMIATVTPQAWTGYLERRSIGTKLIRVNVGEPTSEEAIRVLMARSGYVEYQNHVFFSYAAIDKAVSLAGRYLREVRLPESALNVIKEAAVLARRERGDRTLVTGDDVARVIHDKTSVPVEAVTRDESDKLLALEDRLHGRVIGQDEAVKAVAQAMRRARAEVREGRRPIANFLFLGPTGVGKTELSKALAAEYFGSEKMMIRLDMSEYQHPSAVARIIGEPGDERGGLLTEAVRKQPFTIVLLDELEKAHPDILTLFLQVMDDGRLTDGVGRTIDFTNVVLIATSNAGTQYIQDEVSKGTPLERVKTGLMEQELKGIFRPEFLNRFDGIIVFKPLTMDDVVQIAYLQMEGIRKRLDEKGIGFRAEDEAVEELAQAGFDPLFGARPLKRVIQERVENGLADLLLRHAVGRKDTVVLRAGGEMAVEKYQGSR